mgnify:FL=1
MNVALHTIELFAGVGMLGVGLRAGLAHLGVETRTVCYLERESYPASVLAARMEDGALDDAPVWSDVCTFDARAWRGAVDCVIGGFPCQDLSLAGRRAGLDGKRSGLFFELLRIAEDSGARYLFLENVAGIASATASVVDEAEGALDERAAARVLGELADRGWDAEWITLSASEVGASHGRERWFCWAWRVDDSERAERRQTCAAGAGGKQGDDRRRQEAHGGAGESNKILGHATSQRRREARAGHASPLDAGFGGAVAGMANPTLHGRHQGRAESGGIEGRPDAAERSGAVADASRPRQQRPELGTARSGNRGGQEAHGPTEQLRRPLFAPGPADAAWPDILARWPWLAPAIDKTAESVLHGMADGLASGMDFSHRAARLKCCGNGVVPLQAAAAAVVLVRRMMEAA